MAVGALAYCTRTCHAFAVCLTSRVCTHHLLARGALRRSPRRTRLLPRAPRARAALLPHILRRAVCLPLVRVNASRSISPRGCDIFVVYAAGDARRRRTRISAWLGTALARTRTLTCLCTYFRQCPTRLGSRLAVVAARWLTRVLDSCGRLAPCLVHSPRLLLDTGTPLYCLTIFTLACRSILYFNIASAMAYGLAPPACLAATL